LLVFDMCVYVVYRIARPSSSSYCLSILYPVLLLHILIIL
jgi:hypothetical protein